jgi:hypothetical protein
MKQRIGGIEKMIKKPKSCCKCGSYKCVVPMPINKRIAYIDLCIADIVASLNASNLTTEASCCGHGKMDGNILLSDGRWITIEKKKWTKNGWKKLKYIK